MAMLLLAPPALTMPLAPAPTEDRALYFDIEPTEAYLAGPRAPDGGVPGGSATSEGKAAGGLVECTNTLPHGVTPWEWEGVRGEPRVLCVLRGVVFGDLRVERPLMSPRR
eukprot:RCo048624